MSFVEYFLHECGEVLSFRVVLAKTVCENGRSLYRMLFVVRWFLSVFFFKGLGTFLVPSQFLPNFYSISLMNCLSS